MHRIKVNEAVSCVNSYQNYFLKRVMIRFMYVLIKFYLRVKLNGIMY